MVDCPAASARDRKNQDLTPGPEDLTPRPERGVTVFLVEQNARQTLAIADCGYVLAKGKVVAAGTAAELGRAREVHEAYFS